MLITAAVFDDVPAELAGHTVRIRAGRMVEEGSVTDDRRHRTERDDRMPEQQPEHIAVYQRIRSVFGDPALRSGDARRRKQPRATRRVSRTEGPRPPRNRGRDRNSPSEMGWDSPLAPLGAAPGWAEIVGDETAAHADPVGIEEGLLTVRCDSTAWATQLRRMGAKITTGSSSEFPAAGDRVGEFLGPDTPSWKRGPRAIPGRGPRDTYG